MLSESGVKERRFRCKENMKKVLSLAVLVATLVAGLTLAKEPEEAAA